MRGLQMTDTSVADYGGLSRTAYRNLINLNFGISIIENIALLLVSIISSPENYPVHEKAFCTFMAASILHMIITVFIYPPLFHQPLISAVLRRKSLLFKRRILISVCIFSVLLVLFFARHRLYCEAGMYSWFSLCEYFIATLNILFHFTCYWDFCGKKLAIVGFVPVTETEQRSLLESEMEPKEVMDKSS